jgi:hypothetical protein
MAPAMALAVSMLVEAAAAGLTHGEVRRFPLRRLSLGSGQSGSNQRPVDRAVVIGKLGSFGVARGGVGLGVRRFEEPFGRHERVFVGRLGGGGGAARRHRRVGQARRQIRRLRARLSATGRGDTGLLVFVLRVAGRAARLLDLVVDHRDNGVIRDATLARTVVVEDITEPKPALLHELPRTDSFQVGCVKDARRS